MMLLNALFLLNFQYNFIIPPIIGLNVNDFH